MVDVIVLFSDCFVYLVFDGWLLFDVWGDVVDVV